MRRLAGSFAALRRWQRWQGAVATASVIAHQWPAYQQEPVKCTLPTLPEDTPLNELVSAAYQRLRIERDYQDLKQGFGLGHYEGHGWRGFHHHATLSIAAYAPPQ